MKNFKSTTFAILMISLSLAMQAQVSHNLIPSVQASHQIINSFSGCTPNDSIMVIKGTTQMASIPVLPPSEPRPTHPPSNQFKVVHWLHGLGGNPSSWNSAASAFDGTIFQTAVQPRKIKSHDLIDYSPYEDQDLNRASAQVGDVIETNAISIMGPSYDHSSSIAIGHSQGGLILRMLDMQQAQLPAVDKKYGGIVTVCTANQGAQILNNRELVTEFMSEFAADMISGPLGEVQKGLKDAIMDALPDFIPLVFKIPALADPQQIADTLSSFLNRDVGQSFLNTRFTSITDDYMVNSPTLDLLNNYVPDETEILTISSERPVVTTLDNIVLENGTVISDFPVPISWATIHFFLNPSGNMPLFQADLNEAVTAIRMDQTRLDYAELRANFFEEVNQLNRKIRKLSNRHDALGCRWFPNPVCGIMRRDLRNLRVDRDEHHNIASAYDNGVRNLLNFNLNYLTALGIQELDQTVETEVYCRCQGSGGMDTITGPFPEGTVCSNTPNLMCFTDVRQQVTNNWTILPSDGVLSVATQMDIPQRTQEPVVISRDSATPNWNWLPADTRVNYGSTHMAIRNDDIGRVMLIRLFDGNFGDFYSAGLQ